MFKNTFLTSLILFLIAIVLLFPQKVVFAADIVVNDGTSTLEDNGLCSLREAIRNANNDDQSGSLDCLAGSGATDTIILGVNVVLTQIDNVIGGNNGLPQIYSPIVIKGQSSTIERSNAISDTFRFFYVTANGSLTLDRMTLSNGAVKNTDSTINVDDDGGAIYNSGSLTVTDTSITDNVASDDGGSIYNDNGYLKLFNTDIKDSLASNGGGVYSFGGDIDITAAFITGNNASGSGGGLYNVNSTLSVVNSHVSNNSAFNFGAGIYQAGGSNDFLLTDSVVSGNTSKSGAGVYINSLSSATIHDTFIIGNEATNSEGGGILSGGSSTLSMTNSFVTGNRSASGGAAIHSGGTSTIVNSTIAGNGGNSAAVSSVNGTFIMQNSIVWGNVQSFGTVFNMTVEYSAIEGGYAGTGNLPVALSDTIFVYPLPHTNAPTALGEYQLWPSATNPVINAGNNTYASNAGLTSDFEGQVRVYGGTVDMGADEAFCPTNPDIAETATALRILIVCANTTPATDTIFLSRTIDLTTIDNVADGNNGTPNIVTPIIINGNGNTIQRSSAISDTFRIFHVGASGNLLLQNMTIMNGHATDTNPNIMTDDDGGAILNRGKTTLINVIIAGNRADGVGGGFYNLSGTASIENTTIANNHANFGGGIRVWAGTVRMQNSLVHGNRATVGALQIANSATLQMAYSGVEELINVNFIGLGGNRGLGGLWNIFVAPEPATNAPTTVGDYHLANLSYVVNRGENSLTPIGVSTDFEGDTRILNGTVDMGADERAFVLPSQNTNLIFNAGFDHPSDNGSGWTATNSLVADATTQEMQLSFPTAVDGWLRQIRGAYKLQNGLKMVGWVTVRNPEMTVQTFQLLFRDIDLSNQYLCTWSIPANSTATYYMQFRTVTNWEKIRIEMRPQTAGTSGLFVDDVNLRYRPNAPFTQNLICIPTASPDESPTPPIEIELVENSY